MLPLFNSTENAVGFISSDNLCLSISAREEEIISDLADVSGNPT